MKLLRRLFGRRGEGMIRGSWTVKDEQEFIASDEVLGLIAAEEERRMARAIAADHAALVEEPLWQRVDRHLAAQRRVR